MSPLYLDYAATTPPDPQVVEAMMRVLSEVWGNPSSHHRHGFEAANLLKQSRVAVAESVGVHPRDLTFTSGATEAINLALRGYLKRFPGGHVIVPLVEHKAVADTVKDLESQGNITVSWVRPGVDGVVSLAAIEMMMRHDTCLVVCMWVNNETGIINPVEDIGDMARKRNVAFFCDATQALGKVPVCLERHCDMAVFSGHKIYGPKGVGGLWVRKARRGSVLPSLSGGGQECGLRPGTENLPGIAGFAKACELAVSRRVELFEHASELKDLTLRTLGQGLDARESMSGPTVPHILSLTIPGIDNQMLISRMRDIASFSAGSACNSTRHEPSHVLLASGLGEEHANSTIRLSFGRELELGKLSSVLRQLVELAEVG